jgi:hypothetical protein
LSPQLIHPSQVYRAEGLWFGGHQAVPGTTQVDTLLPTRRRRERGGCRQGCPRYDNRTLRTKLLQSAA